jgi:hypothetical protein
MDMKEMVASEKDEKDEHWAKGGCFLDVMWLIFAILWILQGSSTAIQSWVPML